MNSAINKEQTIKDLRARLDRLNRAAVVRPPAQPRSGLRPPMPPPDPNPPAEIRHTRDVRPAQTPAVPSPSPDPGRTLDKIVPGTEVKNDRGAPFYQVDTAVRSIEETADLDERFTDRLADAASGASARLSVFEVSRPEQLLFVDIETTGLSNAPLFLIGILVWDNGGFAVRQFLARDYSEEAAVIGHFHNQCEGRTLLVSFNGKSFDLPYVKNRAIVAGVPWSAVLRHMDLLHVSRSIWKKRLPNCKLQTLEHHICHRTRYGDIPGHLIGAAYHAFVRTGDAFQMADIIRHNMLDLVTLADILTRMPPPVSKS